MNPILFDLGFIQIRWYSFLVFCAFFIGYLIVMRECKKKDFPTAIISDMCFYIVIFSIIGARLYYCLFFVDETGANPYFSNPIDILKIWEGGLAIHGGIIASFIFLLIYTKRKKFNLLELLDIFAPALVIGQCIGRWGNFFNSEAYGTATTLSKLESLHIPKFVIDGMYIDHTYYQPTFFYESIGCLIIFIIILIIKNLKKIENGQTVGMYFILYGILRTYIESLRTDSLMFNNFKIAQIVSMVMIFIGFILLIRPYIRSIHDK